MRAARASNTPLAALASLNEPVFVEGRAGARAAHAAQGARATKSEPYAFRSCTGRAEAGGSNDHP